MRKRNFFALFYKIGPTGICKAEKFFKKILRVGVKIGRKHRPARKRLHPVAILQG